MLISYWILYPVMAMLLLVTVPPLYWAYQKRVNGSTQTIKEVYLEMISIPTMMFMPFTLKFWKLSFRDNGTPLLLALISWAIALFFTWMAINFTSSALPFVAILHDKPDGRIGYTEYVVLGRSTLEDGSQVSGKWGTFHIVNHSSHSVIHYSVHYSKYGNYGMPYGGGNVVKPGETLETKGYPDYWFRPAPEKTKSIVGTATRWVIDKTN